MVLGSWYRITGNGSICNCYSGNGIGEVINSTRAINDMTITFAVTAAIDNNNNNNNNNNKVFSTYTQLLQYQ